MFEMNFVQVLQNFESNTKNSGFFLALPSELLGTVCVGNIKS